MIVSDLCLFNKRRLQGRNILLKQSSDNDEL